MVCYVTDPECVFHALIRKEISKCNNLRIKKKGKVTYPFYYNKLDSRTDTKFHFPLKFVFCFTWPSIQQCAIIKGGTMWLWRRNTNAIIYTINELIVQTQKYLSFP